MPFLRGFDDKWTDAAEFIIGLNHHVWEKRDLRQIASFYSNDLKTHTSDTSVKTRDDKHAEVQATLAEFPDVALLSEDVIWTPSDLDGFAASHRQMCTATHTQAGLFGPATGRTLTYRVFTDSWCAANKVREEWQIRDQGAIVRQMGRELPEWTRALIAFEANTAQAIPTVQPPSTYQGRGNDNEWGKIYSDLLSRILNGEMSVIAGAYDRAVELAYPSHTIATGHSDAEQFWLGLRSAFPSATVTIEHAMGNEDPLKSPRAALRFSLRGRHDGYGMFGSPTGAEVYVTGITHVEFGPRGIRREWALIDEIAIWKQILMHTGAI